MRRLFKILISLVLMFPLSLSFAQPTQSFTISPESLRERLMDSGLTILAAQNRLRRAKLNVDAARGRLFPSLNLGVVAGTLANPSFVLASVDYVLPFLIPGRWFDVKKAKQLEKAESFGFYTTELNLVASTYALALNIKNDMETFNLLQADLADAQKLESMVRRSYEMGLVTEADVMRAQSQTSTIQIKVSRVAELLAEEVSELKMVLNLPQATELQFANLAPGNPDISNWKEEVITENILKISPEKKQTEHLVESAKLEKKSKVWAFISGASAGNSARGLSPDEGASFAFSRQTVRGSFSFGLDYFPNIEIAESQLEDLRLRLKEINVEMAKVVAALTERFEQVQIRYLETKKNEDLLFKIYQSEQRRYEVGMTTLPQLIDSQGDYRQMAFERVRAETDLHLLWLSAHRLLISDQFAKVTGCEGLPKVTPPRRTGPPWNRRTEIPVCDPKSTSLKFSGEYQDE